MLFHVTMDVDIPRDLDPAVRADTVAREKAYCQALQQEGKGVHIWRVVARYSNVSVFDVDSPDELHDLLWNLPLSAYMDVRVTPLCTHPSALG